MEKITKEKFLKRFADADADNAVQERIIKKINNRSLEEMQNELERLRQLDPSRRLSIRVHE